MVGGATRYCIVDEVIFVDHLVLFPKTNNTFHENE